MAAKGLSASVLRCEYRLDPLGIDVARPRLSWIVSAEERCQRQKAYRVLVASSEDLLAADVGDLWDSGKVASDATAQIAYAGKRLRSRGRCWWKVRVWDASRRRSPWSAPARWTMGLLRDADWAGARWVGFDAPIHSPEAKASRKLGARTDEGPRRVKKLFCPPARYLRKAFRLRKAIRRATATATAMGIFELRINGRRVGEDWFVPGCTDYDQRLYYRSYDVTSLLREGDNAVGAILADGWYAGYTGWGGRRELYGGKIRLRAQLHVEYADGTSETIVTNGSWRAATGPILEADFLMGETHDARREMPGWDAPGFDAGAWHRVNVTKTVAAAVQAAPAQGVRAFDEIRAVRITEPKDGRFVFDLGRNFAGVVRLKVAGARRGQRIVLRFAERLNPDGTIYTTNLRGARSIDTYYCRGAAEETWQPNFTFHGFQYVEVRGYPGKPPRGAVTGIALSSDTPVAGHFECSDKTANQLYANICCTQRANFIDIPTDCPQRDERLGWTGDAQIYIRTAAWNTDVAAFFTKWLVDLEDARSPAGAYPDVAPRKVATGGGTAAWAEAGIICPWTVYQVYGDTAVLRRHYAAMAKFIELCRESTKGTLLRPATGYGDWLSIRAETPKDVLATAYFAHATDLMSRIAAVLGKRRDAAKYKRLFERIRTAFNDAYVADDGRIQGNTQTVYVLALAFDLLPETLREAATGYLVEDIRVRKGHLSTGFVGTKDLMLVLSDRGEDETAYRLFHNRTFPSWGFSIRHGATSIWERWDGWTPAKGFQTPGMNSFAHYAFGAVGQWMFETIGGIDTAEPGFGRIVIRPRPGGKLTFAKVAYDSIRGPVACDWKLARAGLTMDVTIPANATASVHVPAVAKAAVTEGGKPAARARGVTFVGMSDGSAVYEVGSGTYRFVSKGFRLPSRR